MQSEANLPRQKILLLKYFSQLQEDCDGLGPVVSIPSLTPTDFRPAPWMVGQASLRLFGFADDWSFGERSRAALEAKIIRLKNAVVHSVVGLVETSAGNVIKDTLQHTNPERDGYVQHDHSAVAVIEGVDRLDGSWVHCLLGNDENYFHFLLMNIGRPALLDSRVWPGVNGILVPEPRCRFQTEILEILLKEIHTFAWRPNPIQIRTIALHKAFLVEELVIPWNAASATGVHSKVVPFLRQLISDPQEQSPKRCTYISRVRSPNRRLINEDEVISFMQGKGFDIVELENLHVSQQATVFHKSHIVVAPHGAGLANLVFSETGTRIVEIMPDRLVNWCYRSIAETCGLSYDCILSRSFVTETAGPSWAPTRVSVAHLSSAIDHALVEGGTVLQ